MMMMMMMIIVAMSIIISSIIFLVCRKLRETRDIGSLLVLEIISTSQIKYDLLPLRPSDLLESQRFQSQHDNNDERLTHSTYIILGVPYYNYSIMGPKTLF